MNTAHPEAGRYDNVHGDEYLIDVDADIYAERRRLWEECTSDLICNIYDHKLWPDLRKALLLCNKPPIAKDELFAVVGRLVWSMMDDEAEFLANKHVFGG